MTEQRPEVEVRLERLRPAQIDVAMAEMPVIYLPCGSIEWHGRQNAVGLDTLKAHEQLILLARRIGGLVYPPLFLGVGGGHLNYPHTFMVGVDPMVEIVAELLRGFERDGFETAVLLSGHYPNRREYFDEAIRLFREGGGEMRVIGLVENEVEGVGGDHAALYETSYMMYLHPDLVDLYALSGDDDDGIGGPEERRNWMAPEYHDHPCYGIVGIDPRGRASAEIGRENTERLIAHLSDVITGA